MIWILSLWIKKENATHVVAYHEDPVELLKEWMAKDDEYGFLWLYQNPARKLVKKYVNLESVKETYFDETHGYYAPLKLLNIKDEFGSDVNEVYLYVEPLKKITEEPLHSWTNLSRCLSLA